MPVRARKLTVAGRRLILLAPLALLAVLGGCGSALDTDPAASVGSVIVGVPSSASLSCQATVLDTLGRVLGRVYREGVRSERTAVAHNLIAASKPLRTAVEHDDPAAARAAAEALLATGHMTNLRVLRGSQTLADVGGDALAPFGGTLKGASGAPIGSYVTSVWSDAGFITEAHGISEGLVALRAGKRSIGASYHLPAGRLADEGVLTHDHVRYRYTSFPASAYPAGTPLRIYLLRSIDSTSSLCGASSEATLVNTLTRIANLIYEGEAGRRTLTQVHRVQSNGPLLEAVAHNDPVATRAAIFGLLNHHIVRMRVSDTGGQLISDVGGPYVLAPVKAPLSLGGHAIGDALLSIQDDEGYLRLTGRLAGLKVLMYMNPGDPQLVKNSLGPEPGNVPAEGAYRYRGHSYRVFTVKAGAFPSGPLTIRVLVPIPYS